MRRAQPTHSTPRTSLHGPRSIAIAALLLAATAAFTGCTTMGTSGSGGSAPDIQQVAPDSGEAGTTDDGTNADRSVVSTASISLISPDPADVTERVAEITTDAGGRVDTRTDSPATTDSPASGSLVVRIPSDRLDDALDEIKATGELRHSSLNATDVTDQVTDLDARVTALRASVARLLALIDGASSTADLIELESALSERQAELDSLEAQRDSLGDAIEYATVQVEITSPDAVAGAAPGDFWGGIVVGFSALVAFFSGLLVVLGILLPWLVLLALLAGGVLLVVRRRRPARTESPSAPQQPSDTNLYGPGQGPDVVPPRPTLPVEQPRSTSSDQTPDTTG